MKSKRFWLLFGVIGTLLPGCASHPSGVARTPVLPASPAIFRDVAQQVGLRFRWGHGGKSPLNIVESLGHGCAFMDYDQDGLLDILLVGNRHCALYHNLGNSRFEDVTAQSGLNLEGDLCGVAVGDYDNDGYPDVYITGYGKCWLFHNESGLQVFRSSGLQEKTKSTLVRSLRQTGEGGGSKPEHLNTRRPEHPIFRDVTAKSGLAARGPYDVTTAAAFVDLDGDGRLDLFVGHYIVFTPASKQLCDFQGVLSGCGVKDYPADFPHVYRNLGGGIFKDVTHAWGFDTAHGKCLGVVARAQDNGRGVMLYAANDEVPGDLFVPNGRKYVNIGIPSGTAFRRNGLTQGGMGVDWGDFLHNGHNGLVVATFQWETPSLYRNDGDSLYSEVGDFQGLALNTPKYVKWTAKFFDYDNDGWPDLFFTCGHTQDNVHRAPTDPLYPQPMLLYHNERCFLFKEVSAQGGPAFQHPIVGRGAAFGDFDNDGRMDVLVVNEEGAPLLLHNEDRTGNHWLGVRLVGTRCNRDGIGARVRIQVEGQALIQDQQLSGGYLSSNDPRLHFGLGKAQRVAMLQVHWPNGDTDTVRDIPTDRYIQITQGKGLTPF